MLYNLLSVPEGGRIVGLGEATLYAALGFFTVFLGIAFLIAVVWLVGKVMGGKNSKKITPQPEKEVASPVDEPVVFDEVDGETLAIIMAALMTYYETNNPKCEFTLKRIKRI